MGIVEIVVGMVLLSLGLLGVTIGVLEGSRRVGTPPITVFAMLLVAGPILLWTAVDRFKAMRQELMERRPTEGEERSEERTREPL
jgi:phosphatidylglycerophosphate synthase